MKTRKTLIAYMPVIHRGYIELLEITCPSAVILIGDEILMEFPELDYLKRKDSIRAVPPSMIADFIRNLDFAETVCEGTIATLGERRFGNVVMPDEDITRAVAERYFHDREVEFVRPFPRLRWHRGNVEEKLPVSPSREIPVADIDREMMSTAGEESQRSWDWWRQVGGVLVTADGLMIVAYNEHIPDNQVPYVFGDPRSMFRRGIRIDLSTGDHAEHVLIGEAARRGISLKDAVLYLTTFPCPLCARLIRRSGVRRLFFSDSYAILDGEEILKSVGVELIRVILPREEKKSP